MENKINIAELLKDCPQGMELDCTLYDNCTFDGIEDVGYINILVKTPTGQIKLSKEGCFVHNCNNAKCVIFPKGKTTWEGFVSPVEFKDGDILVSISGSIFIYKPTTIPSHCGSYAALDNRGVFHHYYETFLKDSCRLATEGEKQKLFNAIKVNGYKWDEKTRTLKKLTFENGDIIVSNTGIIAIFSHLLEDGSIWCHCSFCNLGYYKRNKTRVNKENINDYRFATEEEKQKFFKALKDNGYRWNPETKTLEKLVIPKFKVGDRITNSKISITIGYIDDEYYYEVGRNTANRLSIKNQDMWTLVPNKFNITTLKPFDEVLVRNSDKGRWIGQFYTIYDSREEYPFECVYNCWKYCIPYKGNEHLLDKTDDCDDFYKTWEK